MTTTKKLTIAVVALSLALLCTVGGTLAFLVATSNTVTNTFTYGEIQIELSESKGTVNGEVREFGKVVPGATIEKDPKVTVKADSEKCYVYAKIVNNVVLNGKTVVTCNIDTTNWTAIGSKTNNDGSVVTLYKYNTVVESSATDTELPELFETVKFSESITSDDVSTLEEITDDIVITAYAHQSENTDENTADEAAIAWAEVTALN